MKRFVLLGSACLVFAASQPVLAKTGSSGWIPLQDGKTLDGWKAPERPESWVVEDGVFVSRGERSHLYYVGNVGPKDRPGDFRNFELSAEVMTVPGSNSGIYVHTKLQPEGWPAAGYEIQVINSNPPAEKMGGYIEHKMTGSIYAVRNTWVAPAKDNEWFTYRIRVVGKTIQTFINDRLICEYAEPTNPFRPDDKKGRLLGSGTFALQAHDPGSIVKYRNIKVKLLPNSAKPPKGLVPIADRELDELVTQASNDNIPLIELGGLPKEPFKADLFLQESRRYGMNRDVRESADSAAAQGWVAINDGPDMPDPVEALRKAKADGKRVVFTHTGGDRVDEAQLKRRLKAIKAAGLGWKDFWVPGKP